MKRQHFDFTASAVTGIRESLEAGRTEVHRRCTGAHAVGSQAIAAQ